MNPLRVTGSACLSPCGRYRYELTRSWDGKLPKVAFVMLNPSKADATIDDPTIRKCIGLADRWGYGELRVYNLFALRATDPEELLTHPDPIGPVNNRAIVGPSECDLVVCAWGSFKVKGEHEDRASKFLTIALTGLDLYALAVNLDGNPRHPLYVKNDTQPVLWRPKA